MSPDIDSWAGNAFPLPGWLDDIDAGVDTARLISDKSTSIVVVRAGAELAAQTVRIEDMRRDQERDGEGGLTGMLDALVLGYKGHPTITDTDIQRGDRFYYNGSMYDVIAVAADYTDSLQAYARARS